MVVDIGTSLPPLTVVADVARMKTMAVILRDPNPIHWDVDAVRRLGMGDRAINQGPVSIGYVLTMLNAWTGDPRALRRVKVRCLGNVFDGEAVTARGTVTGITETPGPPVGRTIECTVWLERADGTKVLDGTAVVALSAHP